MIVIILSVYVLLGAVIWSLLFAYLGWSLLNLPRLRERVAGMRSPSDWPGLSIVIPACNEAQNIESALESLLAQDYPGLEIIVVNDRSSDATGEIIDCMAIRDTRVKPIHIQTLPAGWLGKVHALHQGAQRAKGEWLLFCDADIHFADGSLKRTITYALHTRADLLALLPRVIANTFWLGMAVRSFGLLFLYATRAALVHRPDNDYFIGVGAFNLVRREAFERTPGFEWLRLEPGDDAALGMMIKQAGGNLRFALAEEELSLIWYPNVRAMFKGLEKNMFGAGAHYQWWRVMLQTLGVWALAAAPLTGLLAGVYLGQIFLLAATSTAIAMHLVFILFVPRKNPQDLAYLLFFPLGLLLINLMMIRSAYCCLHHNGIDWRGTHYPLATLRAGQRMRF